MAPVFFLSLSSSIPSSSLPSLSRCLSLSFPSLPFRKSSSFSFSPSFSSFPSFSQKNQRFFSLSSVKSPYSSLLFSPSSSPSPVSFSVSSSSSPSPFSLSSSSFFFFSSFSHLSHLSLPSSSSLPLCRSFSSTSSSTSFSLPSTSSSFSLPSHPSSSSSSFLDPKETVEKQPKRKNSSSSSRSGSHRLILPPSLPGNIEGEGVRKPSFGLYSEGSQSTKKKNSIYAAVNAAVEAALSSAREKSSESFIGGKKPSGKDVRRLTVPKERRKRTKHTGGQNATY